jgi:hypothetical protein
MSYYQLPPLNFTKTQDKKKKQTARSERKAASKAGNVFSVKGHQRVKVEDLSSEDVVIG